MSRNHLLVVLITVTLILVIPGTAFTASSGATEPEQQSETFTMATESIELQGNGTICAETIGPDRNRVTITNATFKGTTIYVPKDGGEKRIHIDDTRVRDKVVLVTNGENDQLDILAKTGGCIPLSQNRRSVVEAYTMRSPELDTSGVTISVHSETLGGPPEPTGFDIPANLTSNDTDQSSPVSPPSDDPVGNTTGTVDGATNDTTGTANDTVSDAMDTVGDAAGAANDTVNDGTETVNDTTRILNDTTATTNDTLSDSRDTMNQPRETVTDISAGGVDTSNGRSTIDDTTNETLNTTANGTIDETTNATTNETAAGNALTIEFIEILWLQASISDSTSA